MITRACISINNRCNLNCKYCHFHEKNESISNSEMDVFQILDNIRQHIERNAIRSFKIGFVGNGEPLLDFDKLCDYIDYVADFAGIRYVIYIHNHQRHLAEQDYGGILISKQN